LGLYFWGKIINLSLQLKEHLYQVFQSLPQFVPEMWLAIAFLLTLSAELGLVYSRWKIQTSAILRALVTIFCLVALALMLLQQNVSEGYLFHHLLYLDAKAIFFKTVVLVVALLVLAHVQIAKAELPSEFYAILLGIVLGLCLLTMSVNGLSIYLSIELVSIGSYLIASFGKDKKSGEGGLKYLLFGALSSGVMLYGLSFLYGMTGTLDFTSEAFANTIAENPPAVLLVVGLLTLAGVLFKLSLVPFHVWAPDVYEAAPTPVVAFLSTAPKVAALLVFMRILSTLPADFDRLTAVIVLASILVGNLSALWQTNLKRLLAYSGIAQAGFMVVGLVAFNQTGFEGAAFYAVVYVLMNLGAFLLIDLMTDDQNSLQSLAGKGFSMPFLSVCLTVLMISLVGLPPTAGFTAKLFVFSALWEKYQTSADGWLLALLLIGLLNSVISLFYYLKLPFYLFFRTKPSLQTPSVSILGQCLVGLFATLMIVLFFKAEWLLTWIR